jgi:hypothetical protein
MTNIDTPTPRGPGRPRNADRQPEHTAMTGPERVPERDPAHTKARTRSRMRRTSVMDDPFYIDPANIPEGMSVEWKRHSVVGEENPFYLAQMRSQGWEPVDPRVYPDIVQCPPGYNLPHIIKGGQILMERPIELTLEAIRERNSMARQQVTEAEERLGHTPKDTMTRDHQGAKPKISKEYVRAIPMQAEE